LSYHKLLTPLPYLRAPIYSNNFTPSIAKTEYHTGRKVFAEIYPTFRFHVSCNQKLCGTVCNRRQL